MSSDPGDLRDALEAAEDAFDHAYGAPNYEPNITSGHVAEAGEIRFQKACRLLRAAAVLREEGQYYTSVLEHSFAAIERTLEGYLIAVAGADPDEFYDHETAYELAKSRSPLEERTIETIEGLYSKHRTEHYYQETVTTQRQAEEMCAVALCVHDYLAAFDGALQRYCCCR